jgi:hypothetical protein
MRDDQTVYLVVNNFGNLGSQLTFAARLSDALSPANELARGLDVGKCYPRRRPRVARRRLPGSIAWSRHVTRTSDETHSPICGDDVGKASARPAHGRDCPALRTIGPRRGISRHNAPSHQLIHARGCCCICVPIMQNGTVVDSQGFMIDPEDD